VALLEALQPDFNDYQKQTLANARALAATLIARGHRIVSGGTDNHMFLLDLVGRDITGKDADAALGRANITVNKNAVPGDPRPPAVTSGIRVGTPAVTTRGFREAEISSVGGWIADVLDASGEEAVVSRTRKAVLDLCRRFPVYGG
jgi:glycine hydroxymethyltransferase